MLKSINNRVTIILLLTLSLLGYSCKKPPQSVQLESNSRDIMGTFSKIVVVASSVEIAKQAIENGFKQQVAIDELMSSYKEHSQLNQVNRLAFEHPVEVDRSLFTVIEKAIQISEASEGAFDITIAPLITLWKKAEAANTYPTDQMLSETKAKIGYKKLTLDPNRLTIAFQVKGMQLDLGGIAKGYAIDKTIEAVKKAGATAAMVDIGGDIRCFGKPTNNKSWRIGVQDPFSEISHSIKVLKLNDRAVATSGHYRRFSMIEGQKVSHIIEPESGSGSNKLASVTIITNSALVADGFATAVSVLGKEKGMALVKSNPELEAILIGPKTPEIAKKPHLNWTITPGASDLLR